MKIKGSQKNMRGLRLVGEEENGNAFSLYGPMKAGLTTTHKTQSLQLSVSLNSLERKVDDLTSRYLEVSSILTDVLERLVKLGITGKEQDTTDAIQK